MMRITGELWRWCGVVGLRVLSLLLLVDMAFAADETKEVHVIEEALVGGTRKQLRDQTLLTGGDYATQIAPTIDGQIFTHWSISHAQAFSNRDRLGRAKDCVTYHLYEPTTLTANYRPVGEDTDQDGVADGWEIYWYGDLSKDVASDTDGDGMTFAAELAAGTNPLIPNESTEGGIVWDDGVELLYNPDGLLPYTIRSEPEGALFPTITDYAIPGTTIMTPTCDRQSTIFAYWTCNGVRVQDRHGRSLDRITFAMPGQAVEYVAVCVADKDVREQYYWYGREMSMTSDTDGDGMTLAEEIAAGTNPLMPNESSEGGIVWNDGELLQYNAEGYQPYTIRSEPEGALFATIKDIVRSGTQLSTPVCNQATSKFAYWTLNGVRQQDRHGRALDQINFAMPDEAVELVAVCVDDENARQQQYWYGREMSMTSDTDGDGMTLAEEIAAGTNPLMPNESSDGGIVWGDGDLLETDLQVYEHAQGAIVAGSFVELFTNPVAGNGATSETFANGAQIWPVVADVNGDGRFDVIVLSATTTNVFVNVGSDGNPEFSEASGVQRAELLRNFDPEMNSTAKLAGMALDVAPVGALSATTNGTALLVSDSDGRIWYYLGTGDGSGANPEPPMSFVLQHKVWGGSYAGFANGLRLAAVDWEDDGDLDCLCGTAEGKLMLLRNPKVGRPTNLAALAGVDSVQLSWDPNAQSRIRGYKVYRQSEELRVQSAELFELLASPPLPFYRDTPSIVAAYNYRVTSVSRFYTAGNSTPIESESMPTEAVRAVLGAPTFTIGEPVRTAEGTIEITVSINNSLHYRAAGTEIRVPYNVTDLVYASTRPSGLSEKLVYHTTTAGGVATIAIASGEVEPGSGAFFTLVFHGTADAVLKGDLDGDGRLTVADLRDLAKLKSAAGRKWTARQLKAGDLNGNGKLDEADYQALRALLKEQGVL